MYVALGMQHAMRMRFIVICDFTRSTLFFHIDKRHDFQKVNVMEHKMRVLISSTTFAWNISILRRIEVHMW